MKRDHKIYCIPLLFLSLTLILTSCGGGGGGGGGSAPGPPFIAAELDSFPTGSVPPGLLPSSFNSSATVGVWDYSSGAVITTATVIMNGVALAYNPTYQVYEGALVVSPGDAVTLNVTVGGNTYTASGSQFTSYPTISSPAANATWSASQTITWSGGTPIINASYDFGVLDLNGNLVWPQGGVIQKVPISTTSYTIPANSLTLGSCLVIVGITSEIPISNAVSGSRFVIAGLNNVPITVKNLDTTFGSAGKVITDIGSNDYARAVAIQGDGKIVATGFAAESIFGSVPPRTSTFALVRYNTDGSLDTTFGSAGKVTTAIGSAADDYASAMAIQSDGKIVAAGTSWNGTPNFAFALVRYNTDGSLDTTFGGTGKVTTSIVSDNQAYAVAIQGDGKIVAVGRSWTGGNYDFALARYNTDGSLDTTFGGTGKVTTSIGSGDDVADAVAIQGDGKIVVAGTSSTGAPNCDFALVRYNTDGSLDTTFGTNGMVITAIGTGINIANAVVIQGDGKIVAAGYSNNGPGLSYNFALARYNTEGALIPHLALPVK